MRLRQSNDLESARQARRSIFLVRQRLLNPTPKVLESCAPHLRSAIAAMERVQKQLAEPESLTIEQRKALRVELNLLRRELTQVKALLEHGAAFHAAMWELLAPNGDESICYCAHGVIAAQPESTMRIEG